MLKSAALPDTQSRLKIVERPTQIEFVTDRLLITEMMKDPLLSAYSVVIINEAHERTLQTDVLL
jgi:HrpA-like RNA helicase